MYKNAKKLLLPLVSVLTLAACGPTTSSSNSENSSATFIEPTDLKTTIQALQESDNFLAEVKDSTGKLVFSGQYAQNYFYENVSNRGYLVKDEKVYPFYFDNVNVINKEALSINNLYGENGALVNADEIDLSIIPDGNNSYTTLKRKVALPLLSICGYNDSMYGSLNSVKIDYKDKGLDLVFTFSKVVPQQGLKEYQETARISEIGKIDLPLVKEFIANGELAKLDADLLKIRDLFALDNYTQYQTDGTGIVQVDMFHKEYFVTLFTDYAISLSPVLQMNQVAYLHISEPDKKLDLLKDNNGNPVPLIYDDTYRFQFFGSYEQKGELTLITRPNPKRPGYAEGGFQEVVKDVTTAFHYPKGLKLFSNLDALEKVEDHNAYSLTDKKLIANVLADYALTGAFDEFGGIQEIQFIYEFGATDAESKVVLRMVAPAGIYDITYDKFGATVFEPFETLLNSIK